MKKYLKYIAGCLLLGAVASCSDAPDELTSVDYDRLFSPTEISTRVRNAVNVTVSWNAVDKATSYVLELYQGTTLGDAPLRTDEATTNSFIYEGLVGETDYFVRVKAVGEGITESKWVETTFVTGSENIFKDIATEDLGATQVTLRWTAGEEADIITLTPGDIVYNITDDDIAAGAATITGLTPETYYTAVMTRGTSTRGTITFTTTVDVGDADILYATTDTEAIQAFFDGLEDGASVCLLPAEDGTNVFPAMKVNLTKSCSVMGLAAQPVVCGFSFTIEGAGNVTVKDLTFNNTDAEESTGFITVLSMTQGADLMISNCTLQDSKYKNILVETDDSETCALGTLTIENCLMTGISGRGIDFQKKKINFMNVSITNSTFYEAFSTQDFIRFDYTADRVGAVYMVSNNTFYNVNTSSKGIAYIRSNSAGDKSFTCTFSKNIFGYATAPTDVFFSEDAKSDNILFDSNYYFNASSLIDESVTGGKVYDTTGTVLTSNPFVDAANGDFTLSNEDLIYEEVGDPRWRQ